MNGPPGGRERPRLGTGGDGRDGTFALSVAGTLTLGKVYNCFRPRRRCDCDFVIGWPDPDLDRWLRDNVQNLGVKLHEQALHQGKTPAAEERRGRRAVKAVRT